MKCEFPTCTRHPLNNGYCISHQHYAPKPLPPKHRPTLRKESPKKAKENAEYKKHIAPLFEDADDFNRCQIKSPICSGMAQGMQHKKRRGKNLLKYLKKCCNNCNLFCELKPEWAIANGHALRAHTIDEDATDIKD